MEISPEISNKIRELQILEQNLQEFIMQRQSIQLEINEIANALEELKGSGEEVYKILSGMMVKSSKTKIIPELEEKKKLSEIRINSIEKQEKLIFEKTEELRKEITKSVGKNKSS